MKVLVQSNDDDRSFSQSHISEVLTRQFQRSQGKPERVGQDQVYPTVADSTVLTLHRELACHFSRDRR